MEHLNTVATGIILVGTGTGACSGVTYVALDIAWKWMGWPTRLLLGLPMAALFAGGAYTIFLGFAIL